MEIGRTDRGLKACCSWLSSRLAPSWIVGVGTATCAMKLKCYRERMGYPVIVVVRNRLGSKIVVVIIDERLTS